MRSLEEFLNMISNRKKSRGCSTCVTTYHKGKIFVARIFSSVINQTPSGDMRERQRESGGR